MQILDLAEPYYHTYFCCLKDWSDELKETGDHKERWFYLLLKNKFAVNILY